MRTYSVPALEKAIAILELLAASEHALTTAEIFTPLGIPKATAFMLLNVLERHGMVRCRDVEPVAVPRRAKGIAQREVGGRHVTLPFAAAAPLHGTR